MTKTFVVEILTFFATQTFSDVVGEEKCNFGDKKLRFNLSLASSFVVVNVYNVCSLPAEVLAKLISLLVSAQF